MPLILSEHPIPSFNTTFAALFLANYTKKNLQCIVKTVLKAKALASVPIIFPEDL